MTLFRSLEKGDGGRVHALMEEDHINKPFQSSCCCAFRTHSSQDQRITQGWCKLYTLFCTGLSQKGLAGWSQFRQQVFLKWLYTVISVLYLKPHRFIIITFTTENFHGSKGKKNIYISEMVICSLLWRGEVASFERLCLNQRKIVGLKHKPLVSQQQACSSCNILHS